MRCNALTIMLHSKILFYMAKKYETNFSCFDQELPCETGSNCTSVKFEEDPSVAHTHERYP